MSVTDGLGKSLPTLGLDGQFYLVDLYGRVTLGGNLTLTKGHRQILGLDPGGSARDVTLPAENISKDFWFLIVNRADAAENLVVKDDGGATIATLNQNEAGGFWCDGTAWYLVTGVLSAALS